MKKLIFLSVILLAATGIGKCQTAGLWKTKQAYLGQIPPGDVPVKFAPALLKDTGSLFTLGRVAFSPDGTGFYYCVNDAWFSGKNLKLKYFEFRNGKWNRPMLLNEHYYDPTFSPDGKTLYLMGGTNKGAGDVVWQSHKVNGKWSEPVEYIRKPYVLYDFMPTISGNIYVGSNGTWGANRDYNAWKFSRIITSKTDTTIENLGTPLNSPGFNGDFFVAKDESYMIISTNEWPTFECELYISYRKPDGTWTNPKSLGPEINNDVAHRWGEYVSPDGKYLFYSRGHSAKDCAIYWVRFDKLFERLKHTNFEPYVKNPVGEQSAIAGQQFSLKIPDDTFFDDDGNNTLSYSVTTGDGKELPAGLGFEPLTRTIQGKPAKSGDYVIKVTATDTAKANVSLAFLLKVGGG